MIWNWQSWGNSVNQAIASEGARLAALETKVNSLGALPNSLSSRVTSLEAKVKNMATSQQVTDILAAVKGFEAEVQTDVGKLLTTVTTLNQTVADLNAKLAAGTGLSAEDAAALSAGAQDLLQQTTDLHNKVNPADATASGSVVVP